MRTLKFKKLLGVLLILSILLGNSAMYMTSAEDVPVTLLSISSVQGERDSNVIVSVTISVNSHMAAGTLVLRYDKTKVEVVTSVKGSALTGGLADVVSDVTNSKVTLAYINVDGFIGSGSILDVTFKIKQTATGNIPITLDVIELADNTYKSIPRTITQGNIKIIPKITIGEYIKTPTNQDITVSATVDSGTLNTASHVFTENDNFDFIATDEFGSVSTKTVTITNIDKTAPIITVKNEQGKDILRNEVVPLVNKVKITISNGTLTVKRNGSNYTIPNDQYIAGEGTYEATATDLAGNVQTASFIIAQMSAGEDKIDTETNIRIECAANIVPVNTEFIFVPVPVANITNPNIVLSIDESISSAFNISLKSNGVEIQPNGLIKIHLPIPTKDLGKAVKVFHIKDDGSVEEISATIVDGNAVFETDHFSDYIIVSKENPPVITVNNYIKTPTNQNITVSASTSSGSLNATSHTFTQNGTFDFVATDIYGNVITKKITITNIDKTPPIITGATVGMASDTATINFDEGTATLNGVSYSNGSIIRTTGTYELIVTDLAGNTSSVNFTVNNTPYSYIDGKITGVFPTTKLLDLKNNIRTVQGETIKIFDKTNVEMTNNAATIGTGMYVKFFSGNTVMSTKTIVIYGDVSGDGFTDISDLSQMKQHLMKGTQLTGDFEDAGDTGRNGSITISELLDVKKHILGIKPISQFINDNFTGINPKTKLTDLIATVSKLPGETPKILSIGDIEVINSDAKIGTGMCLQVLNGSNIVSRRTVIIYGDVNGDGESDVIDLAKLKLHLLNSARLSGVFLTAGDLSNKGYITISDLLAVKKQILGLYTINQTPPGPVGSGSQIDFKGSSLGEPSRAPFNPGGGSHDLLVTYQNNTGESQTTVFIVNVMKNGQLYSTYSIDKVFAPSEEYSFSHNIYIPATDDGSIVEVDYLLVDSLVSMKTKHDTVKNSINNIR